MTFSESKLKTYSDRELAVLKGVIDYSDKMVFEDKTLNVLGGMADSTGYYRTSQVHLYKLLRKSAYAKTVVIKTELKGILEFRLSPTEAVYPNLESGYCTPHSNVGRLITICHSGYEGFSKLWGEYRVLEVRSFDRYGGRDFEINVRNFLQMLLDGDEGTTSVHDLRGFVARTRTAKSGLREIRELPIPAAPDAVEAKPILPFQAVVSSTPDLVITEFVVTEEEDKAGAEVDIEDDSDLGADDAPVKQEDYYGLSERFFTHQTIEQNQIIARSPFGAMFVEGIAGSGKTSAALGRIKMLTTFDATKISTKEDFQDVVGPDQDHWAAEFAGQFSQESSIGFVRTGELIQYLQETCRRIDLPDLPVHEYKELQTRLREHRALVRSATSGRRWSGLIQPRDAHKATTMAWLHATDQAIAKQLASLVKSKIPSELELSVSFESDARSKVNRVSRMALDALNKELQELSEELFQAPREGTFSIDRLAIRILNRVDEVRKRVLGSKVIWTHIDGKSLFANDENSLARQLVENKAALYFRTGQRLVFLDENGLVDKSLILLTQTGEVVEWGERASDLIGAGKLIVRELSGKLFRALPSDINHLFIRLVPEATERIYVLVGEELKRLPIEKGWGRVRLPLIPAEKTRVEPEIEDEFDTVEEEIVAGQTRYRTPDAEFKRIVVRRLLQPLSTMADLYLSTLKLREADFPDTRLARTLSSQLEQYKLAEEDIDLLLCLSHLVGRGLKQGGLRQLHEPSFYQTIFVDEVQDFTEQQVFLMVEQANPKYRAVTVVGDTAQKLHHGSSIDLRGCFSSQSVSHVRLTENLRQADRPGLALFSAVFRTDLQNDAQPTGALVDRALQQGGELVRPKFRVCKSDNAVDQCIIETLADSNLKCNTLGFNE